MATILRRAAAALVAASLLALAACSGATAATGDEAPAAPVSTSVDDFSFASLDVDYTLSRADDGTSRLKVVERFVAQFPEYDQNHGMRRTIPDSYQGVPLHPELVSITDGDGAAREQEVAAEEGAYSMTSRADGYVHGAQTYVFTYTLENVIGAFKDTHADEFYWDVNGVDWGQSFGRITATLHLAPDLAAALTGGLACYRGYQGSADTCAIEARQGTDAGTDVFAETSDVGSYQTMTVAVGFEPGTFTPF